MEHDRGIDFNQIYSDIRHRKYRHLGTGSGRIVFDLGNDTVAKVARNRKGIAQNSAEYKIGLFDDTGLFAKVLGISDDLGILIMEKAKRINSISYIWRFFKVKNNYQLYRTKELQDISRKNSLELRDFGRPANWGLIGERPVIIDFGFTQEVCKRYYMPLLFRIVNRLRSGR